ncbi:MAG: hypothetical protein E7312_06470 [Clostridiales bacterium]|nr:hypothetical protein [Clostridiales bacterium]
MTRFVKLFTLILSITLAFVFVLSNASYWIFNTVSANIFSHSDATFDGELKVTVSTEDYGKVTIPYDFSGQIKNIAQRTMSFSIASESYVDGITSYDNVYYTKGNTYISSNIWLEGVDVFTEKIRLLPVDTTLLSKTHELEGAEDLLLTRFDYYSNIVDYKKGSFKVNVTAQSLTDSVMKFALDRVNNSNLTATEKAVKTQKYKNLLDNYHLDDVDIAYKPVDHNTIYVELKASVTVKESFDFPCDRVYDVILKVNVSSDEIDSIALPLDLSSYKLKSQLYPN